MPAQWTADLIGKMHLCGVTAKQLAAEAGWHEKYLSAVLNGHRKPKGAQEKLNQALLRLEIKKEREAKGLSIDLHALIAKYRELDPEYAEQFAKAAGINLKIPSESVG